uniref:Uncharacterized protein n=1 Tax=Panagrolaimus sp. ES5 TaxID=591445 RepID=A0AC34GSJ9_9BILA
MKSCKTFKLLHLQLGQSYLKALVIARNRHTFDMISFCIDTIKNPGTMIQQGVPDPKYEIHAKTVTVLNTMYLVNVHPLKFDKILPKLDLSKTCKLYVNLNFEIKEEFMKILLQPCIADLTMKLVFHANIDPVLLAFQRCPKLKDVQ